ncbi:MAG: DUF4236 domain-containing protein [Streptomycetaceae bacterium]|nr:DUF4236 domain-containing protein [Streptomycetaceae bacterium]
MPIYWRTTITLIPGSLRLNINKKSISLSVGPRGFDRTYSSTGRRSTYIDLPGPFSYRSTTRGSGHR